MEKRTKPFLELGRLKGVEKLQDSTAVDCRKIVQYFRVAVDNSENTLSKFVELASESQSFYRSVSLKQWLRTAISKDQAKDGQIIVYSNVVPRQAYLKASCPASRCRTGFSPVDSMIDGARMSCSRSCENCALAEQMKSDKREKMPDVEVDRSNTLVEILRVKDLENLAPSVYKVLWNWGTFVRKKFNCKGILERELLVAAEVLHPNIVHCFGFSLPVEFHDCQEYFGADSDYVPHDDGVSFSGDMFMEWLDLDLQRFLNEKGEESESPFSFREVLDILLQIARGMEHLHEKNFLHGDLKTQNIFMSCFELAHSGVNYYLVKVGDFGCAQRVNASGETVEPFCAEIGTTRYTAPEVFRCRRKYGSALPPKHPQKVDVYSFGVVAFQVLTGVANIYVDCYRERQVEEAVVKRGIRPTSNFKGTLDDDRSSLLPFIQSCWDEDPEKRPTFSEICGELKKRLKKLQLLGETHARCAGGSLENSPVDCGPNRSEDHAEEEDLADDSTHNVERKTTAHIMSREREGLHLIRCDHLRIPSR